MGQMRLMGSSLTWVLLWVVSVFCLGGHEGLAAGLDLNSAGLRGGLSATQLRHPFYQEEAFCAWSLPWESDRASNWDVATVLDVSAGLLTGRGREAFIGTCGPSVLLSWRRLPLMLDVGCSPTFLGRDEFGGANFGVPIQFTTHGALRWNLSPKVDLGYRFQHMSNARLSEHNPGLNLHMLVIGYHF